MAKTQLLDLLHAFINQRPGLNWQDYNDAQLYRRETREIYRDLVLGLLTGLWLITRGL